METTPPDISSHFHFRNGFCYPDWPAVWDVIETSLPEPEWGSAWEAALRSWVERTRDRLGCGYQIHETPCFMILSNAPERLIRDARGAYEGSLKRILAHLEGAASVWRYGKCVVMMFGEYDDYHAYSAWFYPEEEYPEGGHPLPGCVCLNDMVPAHFAFLAANYHPYLKIVVRELTRDCLGHLPVPGWLEEALALRMEEVICGSDVFQLNREICDRHATHWNAETIQQFWTGRSWELPGDSFELGRSLAQILWRKIETALAPPHAAIQQFILAANLEDGGEAACRGSLGLSLGDFVTDFLGEGDWAPEPEKWTGADVTVAG